MSSASDDLEKDAIASSANSDNNYRDVLVEDVKAIYTFQHNLGNLRGLILGASLAAIAALITYRARTDGAEQFGSSSGFKTATVHFLLLGIACSTIVIIGAMNRAQVIFGAYVNIVQQKLAGQNGARRIRGGFWHCLAHYIAGDQTNKDTITHAFALGVKHLSWAMTAFVVISSVYHFLVLNESEIRLQWVMGFPDATGFGAILVVVSSLAALFLFVWTWAYFPFFVDTMGVVKTPQGEVGSSSDANVHSELQATCKPGQSVKVALSWIERQKYRIARFSTQVPKEIEPIKAIMEGIVDREICLDDSAEPLSRKAVQSPPQPTQLPPTPRIVCETGNQEGQEQAALVDEKTLGDKKTTGDNPKPVSGEPIAASKCAAEDTKPEAD